MNRYSADGSFAVGEKCLVRATLGKGKVTVMKIPDINGIVSIGRTPLDPKAQQVRDKAVAPDAADRVELSTQSQDVQRLAAQRTSSEQARADEVAALKAAYDAGQLKADTQQTAQAMVAEGLFDDIIGVH